MKRFGTGLLIGFLLCTLFSAPWMYQAWAVGSCAVFRTWNTGDTVTAADLNSSFTTAAVTNSTPQCLDDFSATVSQMQSTANPYSGGTESLATSTAGEIERLRFMFQQVFGLTNWYRHDQAPTFSVSHINVSALHLTSSAGGGTDTTQNQFLSRFPVLTGPNHWTGIWWPHNTTHMAISVADYNHAQGGVQGGIELFRFHARGLIFHHTVSLMFKHSESQMHGGQRGHITALSVSQVVAGGAGTGQDQLTVGHAATVLRLDGTGITGVGGTHKALFLSTAGHVFVNSMPAGLLKSVRTFSTSDTWTRPAGVRRVLVEVVGGGGGGGGTDAAITRSGGGGGGGGSATALLDVSAIASSTITVGAAGGGGAAGANDGTVGGNSSWADGTNTVTGNGGGFGRSTGSPNVIALGGTATGGAVNVPGGGGAPSQTAANSTSGPVGGGSKHGFGGNAVLNGGGTAGVGFGGGGGGASNADATARAGGNGSAGIVIVWEYE